MFYPVPAQRTFVWPLAHGVTVQVTFIFPASQAARVTAEHCEDTRDYLALAARLQLNDDEAHPDAEIAVRSPSERGTADLRATESDALSSSVVVLPDPQ